VAPSGVILYPKPAGVTSHDVVARVRSDLRERLGERVKVGHAGTLDPFATGLLLVLVGPATRTQRFFMALPKTYRVVARLGWRSTTGDPEGELVHTGRVPDVVAIPVGEQLQRPPAYSAVKVGGERLYRRARRGESAEAEARRIHVHRFELVRREAERAEIELECSSGTYVRELVADLGDAYCEELERTAIGPFRLEDADPDRIVPRSEARVSHGVPLARGVTPRRTADNGSAYPIRLTHGARVVAIAEPRKDRLKPLVVFPE